ncbi:MULTISPECIES: SGNH/GDSL hydrolase family protein [unclassified Marinobacter]|uniref:SGNH/GDSL hydrolase family protein n=1 Tax=unclassified Marinobacter TaxID=83889 RepID=UPI0019255AF2|nr:MULTISPECIES: SGNH/GDSL hydrolase family protein [unclassified Marinobacter]MBL3826219.1 SGNH/GDSL hydrolase family protein [Marinobacter sp. MC3]MBL3894725.1 SGNH/GDSL hydrolase family protein [Marinobacter sp. MW3]
MRREFRYRSLVANLLLILVGLFGAFTANAKESPGNSFEENSVISWTASPQKKWEEGWVLPTRIPSQVRDTTIHQVLRLSLGGESLRLAFSNKYGEETVNLESVTVREYRSDVARQTNSFVSVEFDGKNGVAIAPGTKVVSDPVEFSAPDRGQVLVSIYLEENTDLSTFHWDGRQTAFYSSGDTTEASTVSSDSTNTARVLLSEVWAKSNHRGAIGIIGNSITDGNGASLNSDSRWPDFLAQELVSNRVAVFNAGISGNRLLKPGMGDSALVRFEDDVLNMPGVHTAIVLIGINDISWPKTPFAPRSSLPKKSELIDGYRKLIAMGHRRGIRMIGGTLLPFQGALKGTEFESYYSPEKDHLRRAINQWIRSSGAFDEVVDFARILHDPGDPGVLADEFDSGDNLHPGDAGNEKMADALLKVLKVSTKDE